MSNALKKKKKNKFLGYTAKETKMVLRNDVIRCSKNNIVLGSYKDYMVIGYQILHDKYGFALKRITRFERAINEYLDRARSDINMSTRALAFNLNDKYKLNVNEIATSFNQGQLTKLYYNKNTPTSASETYKLAQASLFNYLSYALTILKTCFNFSVRQLNEFIGYMKSYIDTLARPEQFQLTVPMMVLTLAEEVKYVCDYEVRT